MSVFATIKWDTADIESLREDWDEDKVARAAVYAAKSLCDRSVEEGWTILEILLDMFEDELRENDDGGGPAMSAAAQDSFEQMTQHKEESTS